MGNGPAIGVALGGGGAAALAEIGVLEVFTAAGMSVAAAAGTSAGAIVGAALAAGSLDRLRDALVGITRRKTFWLLQPAWPRLALFAGEASMNFIRPYVGERIEDLAIPFAAVATDLDTGEEVTLASGATVDAIRASMAVPGLFPPWRVGDRWLVDGALANPLPVSVARSLGAEFVIAINVLPVGDRTHDAFHAAYRRLRRTQRSGSKLLRGIRSQLRTQAGPVDPAILSTERRLRLADVLSQASKVVHARIAAARLHDEAPDFLLTVPVDDVGLFDLHRTREAVERGRTAARDALAELEVALTSASRGTGSFRRWLPGKADTVDGVVAADLPSEPPERSAV
jgi:NTE family protein